MPCRHKPRAGGVLPKVSRTSVVTPRTSILEEFADIEKVLSTSVPTPRTSILEDCREQLRPQAKREVRQVPAFWPRFEPVFFSPRKARVVFQNALLPFLFSPALPLGAKVLLSFSSLAFTTPFGAEVFRLPLGAKVCLAFSSFSDSPWGRG